MSDSTLFKEVLIGPHLLRLLVQNQNPLIEFKKQLFSHVWLLNQQLPILSEHSYIKEFAQVSNFLWKGLQFQFIEHVPDYQKFYIQQVELEKKFSSDVFPYRLTDYKIFDVSIMRDPHLDMEEKNLIYFVYQTATGLPYRVICPFPYTSHSTLVHYQVLPIKTQISLS